MVKVFIVEDHRTLRALLIELVERTEGLEICGSSESAEAALEAIEGAKTEIALVDVSLPGKSGIELVREVHARSPHILFVMLSGHLSSVYVEDARKAGARAYVAKNQVQDLVPTLLHVVRGGSRFPTF